MRLVDFLYEAGMLKKLPRMGWLYLGVKHPESIADHSFRTAVVAFFLAKMEGLSEAEVNEAVRWAVFHDLSEVRMGDLNMLAKLYTKRDEEKAENEMLAGLPYGEEIKKALHPKGTVKTICADADKLELVLEAKEALEEGRAHAQDFIDVAEKALRTQSAKTLLAQIKRRGSKDWIYERVLK